MLVGLRKLLPNKQNHGLITNNKICNQ